ncbi:MAG TPA: hypothetical protein VJK05_05700 [archaeon]|nr:hypothetical protein [archaeon]
MSFLLNSKSNLQSKNARLSKPERKCMNCGNTIQISEPSGIYERRFCSEECYQRYLS